MIDASQVWKLFNEPLPVLLIGSGLGWLFLECIWKRYQVKKTQNERATKYRTEVEVRFADIYYSLRKGIPTYVSVSGSPTYDAFVLPELRGASLFALIAGGWEPRTARKYYERIQGLPLSSDKVEDPEARKRAEETLSGLAGDLGVALPE